MLNVNNNLIDKNGKRFNIYMFMYFFFKILIDRVCGLSILISSVLMIVLPFPIQYIQNPAPVFIIRFLQGLVEVLKKYKCYEIFYSYQKYCIYI